MQYVAGSLVSSARIITGLQDYFHWKGRGNLVSCTQTVGVWVPESMGGGGGRVAPRSLSVIRNSYYLSGPWAGTSVIP